MQLYGSYTSPFVRHCRIALLQTGLPCEFVETGFSAESKSSPTKKVPFLQDGDMSLTDSSSILRHLREKSGQPFFPELADFELYCTVNTAMDAGINILLFGRMDSLQVAESKYLARQQSRVDSSLRALEARELPTELPLTDGHIRLACFLDWGLFRNRITLDGSPKLAAFLELARRDPHFAATAPPQ